MKKTRCIIALAALLACILLNVSTVDAQEEEESPITLTAAAAAAEELDEVWLDEVWSQIEGVVEQEELHLQETITVSGVRGAELKDDILDKLYYKGKIYDRDDGDREVDLDESTGEKGSL